MESVLTIKLTADGQLQLAAAGPAGGNKVLLLGMLELAKGAILAPAQQPEQKPSLLVARGALPNGNGR